MQRCAINDARSTLASAPIYAQGLAGRGNDVKVIFDARATTASTNGKIVTLPALRLPTMGSDQPAAEKLAKLVYGFIPHEIGHVRYTDFKVLIKTRGELPVFKGLLNGIEDPRQEVEMIDEYPGTWVHLDALCTEMIGPGGFYQQLKHDDPPTWLLTAYSMYVLRGLLRGQQDFAKLAKASRDAVANVLGEGFTTRLDVLLHTQGPQMKCTADAVDLTRRIMTALKQEAETPPAEQQQQQPSSPDEADDGDDTADQPDQSGSQQDQGDSLEKGAPESAEGDEQDGEDGPAAQSAGGQPEADTQSDSSGNGAGDSDVSATPPNDDQRRALNQAMQGTEQDALQDLGDQVGKAITNTQAEVSGTDVVYDDNQMIDASSRHPDGSPPLAGLLFDRDASLQQSGRLRALLRNELQAMQLERIHETTRGSAFNGKRAFRTSQGDRRLFLHQDDQPGLNTAVFLLADVSGSMSGPRLTLASQALFATASALDSINGVACAIGTFPGFGMVLSFGQRPIHHETRFGLQAHGGTPLAQGLMWAGRKLVHRQEQRKIMMVLTDGQPDSVPGAHAQIHALEDAGVEVMGLGIELEMVRGLFTRSAVISDIEQISPAMLEMLGKTLRRHLQAA